MKNFKRLTALTAAVSLASSCGGFSVEQSNAENFPSDSQGQTSSDLSACQELSLFGGAIPGGEIYRPIGASETPSEYLTRISGVLHYPTDERLAACPNEFQTRDVPSQIDVIRFRLPDGTDPVSFDCTATGLVGVEANGRTTQNAFHGDYRVVTFVC